MPRRDEIRIRQLTNLYDLLDDGVENGSDLPALAALKKHDGANSIEEDGKKKPEVRLVHHESGPIVSRRSWSGVLIGLALLLCGTAAILWPAEVWVWHDRIRYLPGFAELVTRMGAQFYGSVVVVSGFLILLLSLVPMRVSAPRI